MKPGSVAVGSGPVVEADDADMVREMLALAPEGVAGWMAVKTTPLKVVRRVIDCG